MTVNSLVICTTTGAKVGAERTGGVFLGVGGVGEEALEGVAGRPVGVSGRLGPELHGEAVSGHADHARVEGVVVLELQAARLQAGAALQAAS